MPAASAAPPPAKTTVAPPPADKPTEPSGPIGNEPTLETYLGEDMAELEQMDTGEAKPPQRGADGKFQKPEEPPKKPQPQDKPVEEKAPEPPKEPQKSVEDEKPSNIRALGKKYDELVKERDKVLQPKIQSLEAKTRDYERQIEELRKSQPDVKPFQEKLSAIEKENQQLREAIRFADYRKSPEFTEKYEKPYNEAWAKAVSEVTQLNMVLEDGTSRKATANDLLALANAPLDQLDDLASQWFPKSAARVIRHVEKVRDLAEAQDNALKEAQKGASEFHTKRTESEKKANESFSLAYQGANTEITKRFPKWFSPDETDPTGNELLKKGYEFADTVFSPNGADLTPEQKAGRLAVIRAKAANHDRLVFRLKSRDTRIAELESKLAEFESTEPPTETAHTPGAGAGVYDPEADDLAELKKLDR